MNRQVAPASGLTATGEPYTSATNRVLPGPTGSNIMQPGHSVRPWIF